MFCNLCLTLLLVSNPVVSQSATVSVPNYPEVTSANVPFYPGVAWSLKMGGTVELMISINKGAVVDARVISAPSQFLSVPSLATVKSWKFRSKERQSIYVKFVYVIQGEPTEKPETPRIELDLPSLVKVTARPFMPTSQREVH